MSITLGAHITIQRPPRRLPSFATIGRILAAGVAGIAILECAAIAAGPSILSASAGAVITWAIATRRQPAIIKAAKALAHAFALTDRPCIDETRALSRAVFLGKE